jgi:hypothetical protein
MDERTRESAFMSALVTEHFVLQSAASTTISEASARASLYVFSLSSALVAIAVDRDSPRWRPPRLSENCRDDCVAAATALSQRRRLGLHRHLCGDFDPGRHRRRVGRWPSRAGRASCGGRVRGEESGRVPRGAAHRDRMRVSASARETRAARLCRATWPAARRWSRLRSQQRSSGLPEGRARGPVRPCRLQRVIERRRTGDLGRSGGRWCGAGRRSGGRKP